MERPQPTLLTWLLAALVIALGLGAGGLLVGQGMKRFKADSRAVTVKGLVEREVQADQAIWTLAFRRAGNSLAEVQSGIAADREAVVKFLRARGFEAAELEVQPATLTDREAQDFGGGREHKTRFIVAASVVVSTKRVELVRASTAATDELIRQGVVLAHGLGENRANPRYVFSKFNDLRPQLLAEATKNARAIAQQFASDSGAAVGSIRAANQGNIQIFGSDGNDESGPWAPTSTPVKRIRVVSTFEFELR
jgi:hypothetical protein